MTPERILAIADSDETPRFHFGSPELQKWTQEHRSHHTCCCHKSSGWYVVIHKSSDPKIPPLRVLSQWVQGDVVPRSLDVIEAPTKVLS